MKIFPKTLFWRIQLWYSLVISLVVSALLVSFYQYEKSRETFELKAKLEQPLARAIPLFFGPNVERLISENRNARSKAKARSRAPQRPTRKREERRQELIDSLEEKAVMVAAYQGVKTFYQSPNFPIQLKSLPSLSNSKRDRAATVELEKSGEFAYVHHSFRGGRTLIFAHDMGSALKRFQSLKLKLALIGVGVVSVAFLLGGWLLKSALFPILKMRRSAHEIAEGHLSCRIQTLNPESELGELSTDLNHTFERLEKSFQQQIRFSSDASHELRTPLTIILTKAQWALRKDRDAEQYKNTLEVISKASVRMKELIESLLDLSRFDSGQKALNLEQVELKELLEENLEMLSPLADAKGLKVTFTGVETFIEGDRHLLNQLMMNLLSNAVKYNREGGEILVRLEQSEDVSVRVKDTGIGISEEDRSQIFGRFYQADSSRTLQNSTGLGLAIAESIVKLHKGEISVESELGVGSQFTVTFPQKIGNKGEA